MRSERERRASSPPLVVSPSLPLTDRPNKRSVVSLSLSLSVSHVLRPLVLLSDDYRVCIGFLAPCVLLSFAAGLLQLLQQQHWLPASRALCSSLLRLSQHLVTHPRAKERERETPVNMCMCFFVSLQLSSSRVRVRGRWVRGSERQGVGLCECECDRRVRQTARDRQSRESVDYRRRS